MHRTWGRRAAGVIATVTLGCASLTSCGSSASNGPPTQAAIATLLATRGAAVLDNDETGFLSGVSTAKPSAGFRRDQAAQFANLSQLPISAWRYTTAGRAGDSSAERAASRKYGATAWIEHVVLHYALREVDTRSSEQDLYLTFIRQNGHVVIAGDSDLVADGGTSWRGPWDFGPIVVIGGQHSLVIGHPDESAELQQIARVVDSAVPAVTAVWGQDWTQQVAVLVPTSVAELNADAGPSTSITTDDAAETVSDGTDPLSGAALGLRLVVNPGALAKLSPVGVQIVLQHEITHIATGSVTSDSSPRWLVEGFADYVAQLHTGQSVTTIAAELTHDVRDGKLPAALPTETTFDTPATSAQAYEEGWLACRLIAARAGQAGLVRFYRLAGANLDALSAVPDALRSVLKESTQQFTVQWRAYLQAQLG